MAVFDLFTGQPGKTAAGQALDTFRGAQTQIGNLADATRNYNEDVIRGGYGAAKGALDQGYDAATGAINRGASGALGYLDEGTGSALGRIDAARGGIGGAYAPLADLAKRFGAGGALYSDALGINGAEGVGRARAAFTEAPGYAYTRDAGIDAINRRRNAAGSLVGGNADRDAIDYVTNLANQGYGSWLDRLGAYNPLTLSATSGAATGTAGENLARGNLDLNAANLLDASGRARAGIATGQGSSLADIANRYFGGQAGLETGESGALTGNMWQGTQPQIAAQMNFAPQMAKTFSDSAAAELQGQKNLLNTGISLATLAAGGVPSFGGATVGDPTFGGFSRPGQSAASVRF